MYAFRQYLNKTESYLRELLLPFWTTRAVEPRYGGFQTNYDSEGRRTSTTEKTLLAQSRCLFSLACALRRGYRWPGSHRMLEQGIEFLLRHFKDTEYGGYYWILAEDGRVIEDWKTVYGHSFLIYAFSEYFLLTGDERIADEAMRLFDLLLLKAADLCYGGFYEHFDRYFNPVSVRKNGGLHKSLDVHMHLLEALTSLYEVSKAGRHREMLHQISTLIFQRMIDKETGCGGALFSPDWTPIPNEELQTVWGADRFEEKEKPTDVTSFGHNIEMAWLYLHSLDILGESWKNHLSQVLPIFDHTCSYGVDWDCGGLYVEGRRSGETSDTDKEFWQQAEALVGFLDAFKITGEKRYWDAFCNIHDFVFTKMINWKVGEWFPLLSREGDVKRMYMGNNWKICYHTVRSMCLVIDKLKSLMNGKDGQSKSDQIMLFL